MQKIKNKNIISKNIKNEKNKNNISKQYKK